MTRKREDEKTRFFSQDFEQFPKKIIFAHPMNMVFATLSIEEKFAIKVWERYRKEIGT